MRLWQDKRQKKWAVVLGRTLRTAQSSSHQQLQAALADAAAMGPPSPMNRGPRGRLPLPALLLPGPLNASTCWIRHRLAVLRQPPTAIAAVGKVEREPRECWSSIEAEGKRAGGLRWGMQLMECAGLRRGGAGEGLLGTQRLSETLQPGCVDLAEGSWDFLIPVAGNATSVGLQLPCQGKPSLVNRHRRGPKTSEGLREQSRSLRKGQERRRHSNGSAATMRRAP